ncbi:SpoVK/Ycf46/Vps4 family AAA+-type ATPase [Nocardioides thalensis]|uniref:SpoVK/Ycf46/Vps4 family AAA+-type ATPase n=1 Tax=Nocardioides thalensis TaxID=1914755 RepID=A0A853C1U4_9ACTN|nr:AAA family ATPase [Nocardioides thalensis]NYJ01339.1 SpoVK/Ycf46/Vps4 family AAA+-type ATPase [Nocardioides thalensis]
MSESVIDAILRAVAAAPGDAALRIHLADLLIRAGRADEAVPHLAAALASAPDSAEARALMARALDPGGSAAPMSGAGGDASSRSAETPPVDRGFDWTLAEEEVGDIAPPMFADSDGASSEVSAYDVEEGGVTLADVGGMQEVKKRLHAAFLAPMRNEALRKMYSKSLRGGLLLYGPPGCGKTFLARALAGEMGVRFMTVSIADVLDMYVGNSEKNVHEIFQTARASAPCVLFLDEVDAIGHKRSRLSSDAMRGAVNQLLLELDGVEGDNEGVFVLAATNAPWDVDAALRRPGRFDRTLLVLPPDQEAREAIWRLQLSDRPVAKIDVKRLAKMTDGYTGADIAHACEAAAEVALLAAAESGELRLIGQTDVEAALSEVRPSVGPWFDTARNVVQFANGDGSYDELAKYMRKARKL